MPAVATKPCHAGPEGERATPDTRRLSSSEYEISRVALRGMRAYNLACGRFDQLRVHAELAPARIIVPLSTRSTFALARRSMSAPSVQTRAGRSNAPPRVEIREGAGVASARLYARNPFASGRRLGMQYDEPRKRWPESSCPVSELPYCAAVVRLAAPSHTLKGFF